MFITAVAMIATGGTASPLLPILVGEFCGVAGGAAGAAITGGDIGSGMFGGAVTGGITGGILGPVSGSAGSSGGTWITQTVNPGIVDLAQTTFAIIPASASPTGMVAAVAGNAIISSGVGAGGAILSNIVTSAGMNLGKATTRHYLNNRSTINGNLRNYFTNVFEGSRGGSGVGASARLKIGPFKAEAAGHDIQGKQIVPGGIESFSEESYSLNVELGKIVFTVDWTNGGLNANLAYGLERSSITNAWDWQFGGTLPIPQTGNSAAINLEAHIHLDRIFRWRQ